MRTSIVIAGCTVIGAGAAGAGALDNLQLKGPDSLASVTTDLLAVCPLADPAGTDGLGYVAGGSTIGENAMRTVPFPANNRCGATGTEPCPAQNIAPMSRSLAPPGTSASPGNTCNVGATGTPAGAFGAASSSEGIVFGLGDVSILASRGKGASAACNGAVADCDSLSDPSAGLAVGATVTGLVDATRYPSGSYTFNGWRDVLRVIFGGMEQGAGNNLAQRTCGSELRQKVADSYGLLFESCSDAAAGCTQIRHAFIRDNTSGTTDMFVALLDLPTVNLTANISPFCNALRPTDPLPARVGRYFPDFQDMDPIRRSCSANEQVCSRTPAPVAGVTRYGLGLVLTIAGTDFLSDAGAFPSEPCVGFDLIPISPPTLPPIVRRCPNGDTVAGGAFCWYPMSASGSFKCLNPIAQRPSLVFDNTPVEGRLPSQADGRVYNLHLVKDSNVYELDPRSRGIDGAFYRIHSTRSLASPEVTCRNRDAASQIGCLVSASPCSIAAGSRAALSDNPNTGALKVNRIDPAVACVQNLSYPLSSKLYVNTFKGFQHGDLQSQEFGLASCFADRSKIDPILGARGLVPLPAVDPFDGLPLDPFCEDFNETPCPNLGNPVNVDACTDNPAGVPGALASQRGRLTAP